MRFNLRTLAASAALAAGLAAAAAPAHADIVFDNTAAVSDISEAVFGSGPLGQSFNSGNGGLLHDVSLVLANSSSSPILANNFITVTLFSDDNTAPGSQIVSLGTIKNSAVATGSAGLFDFTPVASTVLAADTTYWIELSALAPGGIEWQGSDDLSGFGAADSSFFEANFGALPASSFGAFQMAVDVPEPGAIALLATGLLGLTLLRRRARGF